MEVIIQNNYYQYIAVGFATTFLLPQIKLSYQKQSLQEISSLSLCTISIGSGLWSCYMYKLQYFYYVAATSFVGLCSIILLIMKVTYYYKRVNNHLKTIDKQPQQSINIIPTSQTCSHCNHGENAV